MNKQTKSGWVIAHSKNICYLLIGLGCAWAIPYCVILQKDIPSGVITVIGLVYGIGGITSGVKAHADAKVMVAASK